MAFTRPVPSLSAANLPHEIKHLVQTYILPKPLPLRPAKRSVRQYYGEIMNTMTEG